METHPDVELGVGFVGDLEHDGAGQEVQRHRGDLRHVVVSWKVVIVHLHSKVDGDHDNHNTNVVWHPRHHHEVVSHGEHVVHVELGEASIQVGVEKVHELHQLRNKGL